MRLRHTFPEGRTVRGVTIIDNELFVLRMPANNQIEVFNADDYSLQRHLSVPHLRDAVDLASCSRRRCLYVAGRSVCHLVDSLVEIYMQIKFRRDNYLNSRQNCYSYYFRFRQKRPTYCDLSSGLDLDFLIIAIWFCNASACQISSEFDNQQRIYDVILFFQDGGHNVANVLPVSGFETQHIQESGTLFADQISTNFSIHGWGIAISGFEEKWPPYWNSTSSFDFNSFLHWNVTLHRPTKFYRNWDYSWRSYWHHSDFQDGSRQPCWIYSGYVMIDHPRRDVG